MTLANNTPTTKPPRKRIGGFTYAPNCIITYTKKDNTEDVMAGHIWIDSRIQDIATGETSYLVGGLSATGKSFSMHLSAEKLRNPSALAAALAPKGVHVLKPALGAELMFEYIKEQAQVNPDKAPLELVSKIGWYTPEMFYDGQHAFVHEDTDLSGFYFEPIQKTRVASNGSLEDWKAHVLPLLWDNDVLLTATLLAALSPCLPMFKTLGTRLINWHGQKGTGKTLTLQVAATLFGNGADPATNASQSAPAFVGKFKATANAVELLFTEIAPFSCLLDEVTESKSIVEIVSIIYLAASGMGKKRMRSDLSAATDNTWLLTIQTTSENSIAETALLNNRPLNGGEEDRAIDININQLGIISKLGEFASFKEAAGHLKLACAQYYGTAGPAIIQSCINNAERCQEWVEMLDEVENELAPHGCGDAERRVVRHFAAAVIVGCIGIDAGVFPEDTDHIVNSVKRVIQVWWDARANALHKVAKFLDENIENIVFSGPNRFDNPVAFVHGNRITIPDTIFERQFGVEHSGMLKQLFNIGVLIREQQGRNKSRYCDGDIIGFTFNREQIAGCMSNPERLLATNA